MYNKKLLDNKYNNKYNYKDIYKIVEKIMDYRSGKVKLENNEIDEYMRLFELDKKLEFGLEHKIFNNLLSKLDNRANFLFTKK